MPHLRRRSLRRHCTDESTVSDAPPGQGSKRTARAAAATLNACHLPWPSENEGGHDRMWPPYDVFAFWANVLWWVV